MTDARDEAPLAARALTALTWHGAPAALAQDLAEALETADTEELTAALATALEARFIFDPPPVSPLPPLVVVGSPGSGATSAAAKLAARAALAGRPVDLVCADPGRPGAIDQLSRYADAMGARALAAASPRELAREVRARAAGQVVVVDAPSGSPFDDEAIALVADLVEAAGGHLIPVIDAAVNAGDAREAGAVYARIGARRFIAAKCDVARRMGGVLAAADAGLAFGALSASPYIGGGLSPASPLRLARALTAIDHSDSVAQHGVNHAC